MLLLYLNYD